MSSGHTNILELSNSLKCSTTGFAYLNGLFVTIPKSIFLLFKNSNTKSMPSKRVDDVVIFFLYSSNNSCLYLYEERVLAGELKTYFS